MGLATDITEIFSGTVEVDETYLGGQWRTKREFLDEWIRAV
jgi:hypothetical protein